MKQPRGHQTLWTAWMSSLSRQACSYHGMFLGVLLSLVLIASPSSVFASPLYMIDINDADNSVTEPGWTGLDALHTGNGGSVTIDGITFAPFSADGSRLRGSVDSPNPNALTCDFIFDDGAGQAVGLLLGGAGDLQAGVWEVELYIYDASSTIGALIAGYRANGTETIVGTDVEQNAIDPAITFRFTSDGLSAYDVFIRENSDNNRTRLNAVTLTLVPEPTTLGLFGLGLFGLVLMHRKRWL